MLRKRAIAVLVMVLALSVAGMSYAGRGWGPMWDDDGPTTVSKADEAAYNKALSETLELRKTMHTKHFELREAYRADNDARVKELEKEIEGLRRQIYDKSDGLLGGGFGMGSGMGSGRGGCGGPGAGACDGPGSCFKLKQ